MVSRDVYLCMKKMSFFVYTSFPRSRPFRSPSSVYKPIGIQNRVSGRQLVSVESARHVDAAGKHHGRLARVEKLQRKRSLNLALSRLAKRGKLCVCECKCVCCEGKSRKRDVGEMEAIVYRGF